MSNEVLGGASDTNLVMSSAAANAEWKGQTSQKFTTNKRHIDAPKAPEQKHPLFASGQRQHFE